MTPKPTVRYQNILRAIGQGLETLNVDSFDLLEASDNEFVAGGNCNRSTNSYKPKPSRKKSFLTLFSNNRKLKTTRTSVLERFNFVGLRFTRDDIELLDRKGKVLRSSENACPPNPHSIAHILRMTGVYLDYKRSRLLGLSWHQQILTLWHINTLGAEVKEEFTPPDLYDVWVHQFKKRKPIRVLKPTGSD